ncbi:MAG: adenylate/guanylate cyclase domain-containing protein [Pseudohongiellaceae bacterium]
MSSTPFQQLLHPLAFVLRLMPAGARLLMLVIAGVIGTLLITVFNGSLNTLEQRLGELGWTLDPDTTTEQRVIVVAIDERSLAEVSPWPWPREQMARLVTALDQAGVQLQLHDVLYSEAQPGDVQLVNALESARGPVLAQVPLLQYDAPLRAGVMTHPISGVACGDGVSEGVSEGVSAGVSSTQSFLAAHAGFAAIPKGHITPIVSSDGAIRRMPAVVCVDGEPYPALAISALLQATNAEQWGATLQTNTSLLGPAQTLELNAYPGLRIPLDADGNLRISYRKAPDTFQAISAVDVLNGDFEPGMLENTWALIGATAFGIGDIVPTPYNGAAPGVELQARILGSLLDAEIPYSPNGANGLLGLLTLMFAAILMGLATLRGRAAAYGLPVAALLLPVAALTLHIQLLAGYQLWLGWVFPALYSLCAAGLLLLLEASRVRSERSRVFVNLNSYLPSDIAREIAYSMPSSSINARRCDVTLLSADLRNFSAFGEARPPEESAALLHFFFSRATRLVERHGGRIHEFKGDGLLAVWDGNNAEAASRALDAAKEMQRDIDGNVLPQNPPSGLEPLALGIGIEQGPALIGSIGPAHRRSHALLGDTVTITLRIQEMTAELAQPILIGECAARQLSDCNLESQGSYLLSGLRIPHGLFAPALSESPQRADPNRHGLKVVSGGRR